MVHPVETLAFAILGTLTVFTMMGISAQVGSAEGPAIPRVHRAARGGTGSSRCQRVSTFRALIRLLDRKAGAVGANYLAGRRFALSIIMRQRRRLREQDEEACDATGRHGRRYPAIQGGWHAAAAPRWDRQGHGEGSVWRRPQRARHAVGPRAEEPARTRAYQDD